MTCHWGLGTINRWINICKGNLRGCGMMRWSRHVWTCVRPRGRAAADCCSRARFTCYVPPALRGRRRPLRAAPSPLATLPDLTSHPPHPLANITGPSICSILGKGERMSYVTAITKTTTDLSNLSTTSYISHCFVRTLVHSFCWLFLRLVHRCRSICSECTVDSN